jgi:hypothetical protein
MLDEIGRISSPRTPVDVVRSHLDRLPVDLLAIARDLGISVEYNARFDEDPTISGSIQSARDRCGAPTYLIRINGSDSVVRKRFTLAHELSHFLLHKEDLD